MNMQSSVWMGCQAYVYERVVLNSLVGWKVRKKKGRVGGRTKKKGDHQVPLSNANGWIKLFSAIPSNDSTKHIKYVPSLPISFRCGYSRHWYCTDPRFRLSPAMIPVGIAVVP